MRVDRLVSNVDRVVNNNAQRATPEVLRRVSLFVWIYIGVVAATLAVLALLSVVSPDDATSDGWGHAVIVGAFAVLLAVRMRAARRGDEGALKAVGIIASVLLAVNVVEALIPGFLPGWMRIEMIGIAALMLAIVVSVFRPRR